MLRNMLWGYFTITLVVFSVWLSLFLADKTTPKDHFVSWVMLLIAPWFWPIVLPLSFKELNAKAKNRKKRRDYPKLESPLRNLQTNDFNTNW